MLAGNLNVPKDHSEGRRKCTPRLTEGDRNIHTIGDISNDTRVESFLLWGLHMLDL